MIKRISFVGLLVVTILTIVLTQSTTSEADAGLDNLIGADIVFDGYCDGAHLDGDTVTGLAGGYQTGCTTGNMFGTLGKIPGHGSSFAMSYAADAHHVGLHMVITVSPRVWTLYESDGSGGIVVRNSGTWSLGTPTLANDKPSSAE